MVTVFVIGCVFSVHANVDTNKREDHMDHYRWMETDRSQTAEWLNRQSIPSANIIHSLPWRRVFAKRLRSLDNGGPTISDIYDAGDNRFYLRSTPEYAYQRLFVKYKNDPERLIIDPPVGYGINFFSPSPDGRYISYGLSKNGFESTDIKILWVATKDNVRIPLTLIHRKGLKQNGSMPTWLTAYRAYGISIFPDFDTSRLLWLEQGGAIAIAHIRGGGELGPAWHDGGRARAELLLAWQ